MMKFSNDIFPNVETKLADIGVTKVEPTKEGLQFHFQNVMYKDSNHLRNEHMAIKTSLEKLALLSNTQFEQEHLQKITTFKREIEIVLELKSQEVNFEQ